MMIIAPHTDQEGDGDDRASMLDRVHHLERAAGGKHKEKKWKGRGLYHCRHSSPVGVSQLSI